MYEYAVSNGIGTLIDFGLCSEITFNGSAANIDGIVFIDFETVIFAECKDGCETGQ